MEDYLELFARKAYCKIKNYIQMYGIFIVFAVVFMYLISGGDLREYREYYLSFGIMLGIILFAMALAYYASRRRWKKEKQKFSHEELSRINREAAKAPKLEHILLTPDVIGYHIGSCTYLIPVKDIVWVRRRVDAHIDSYISGSVPIPIGGRDNYIDIRTRDGRIHSISNNLKGALEWEVFDYLIYLVQLKRPGVIIGDDGKWSKISRNQFKALVQQVDSQGTRDDADMEIVYNLERMYELCRSDLGNSRKTEVKLMLVFAISYLIAWFFFENPDFLLHFENSLTRDLSCRIIKTYGVGVIVLLPAVLVVGSFFIHVLFDRERIITRITLATYYILGVLSVGGFIFFALMTDDVVHGYEALLDLRAYKSGNMMTYEGSLLQTEKPVVEGIQILKEDQYSYFQGEDTAFKYYNECCVEPLLMQSSYEVIYTPNLQIMFSLKDENGMERLTLDSWDIWELEEEYTLYQDEVKQEADGAIRWIGDLAVPVSEDVCGYDRLTKEECEVFDLLNSELMQEGVEGARVFTLPHTLSTKSFQKINDLYECNHQFDSYRRYHYRTDDQGQISRAYVSTTDFSVEKYNTYSEKFDRKVEKIAARIPVKYNDRQKIRWITDYLLKNVQVFRFLEWLDATDDGQDKSSPEYEKGIESDTGMGALTYGTASDQGYMEAFGAICQKAGIYCIAAIDDHKCLYWNLVKLDGQWLAVNVEAMAKEPENAEQYYLVSNNRMEKLLDAKATYGRSEWFSLP